MIPNDFRSISGICVALVLFPLAGAAGVEVPVCPTVQPKWVFSSEGMTDSSPALGSDGTIYLGTFKGKLLAINDRGYKKWASSTGHEIRSAPSVGKDGVIYFGCRDRKIYALTPGGRKQWEVKTGGWVDGCPALASDGSIIIGSWDGQLYSLSGDGRTNWVYKSAGPISASAAIGLDGVIYFGSHDGNFYQLDSKGREAWRFQTGGAILSSPALDWSGRAYFTSCDGFLYAVDGRGGLVWKVKTGSVRPSSPVLGPGGQVFLGAHGDLWMVESSGQARRVQTEAETVDGAGVVTSAGEIVVAYRNGQACAYSLSLQYLWRTVTGTVGVGSPTLSQAGTLYFPGIASTLTAVSHPSKLAVSPWPKYQGNTRNTGNLADSPRPPGSQ